MTSSGRHHVPSLVPEPPEAAHRRGFRTQEDLRRVPDVPTAAAARRLSSRTPAEPAAPTVPRC